MLCGGISHSLILDSTHRGSGGRRPQVESRGRDPGRRSGGELLVFLCNRNRICGV